MQDQLAIKEKKIKELKEDYHAKEKEIEYYKNSLSFLK